MPAAHAPETTCSGASDNSGLSLHTYSDWRWMAGASPRSAAAALYILRLGTLASVVALKMKIGIFTWLPISSSMRDSVLGATASVVGARSMFALAGSSNHLPAFDVSAVCQSKHEAARTTNALNHGMQRMARRGSARSISRTSIRSWDEVALQSDAVVFQSRGELQETELSFKTDRT